MESAIATQPEKKHAPQWGWRKPMDMAEVERLAGLGMPLSFIAQAVGVSYDTLNRRVKEEHSDFAKAYQSGAHSSRVKVLESLAKGMEKSFIPAIFLAKQPHILGFQDVQQRQVSGEIKLVLEERVLHEPKQISAVEAEDVDVK